MTSFAPALPLHPYLDPGSSRFSLKISLNTDDPSALEKIPFPFSTVLDSDPLTRLHEAHLLSDAGKAAP